MGNPRPCYIMPTFHAISRIKEHASSVVPDEAFAKRAERWPEATPDTKEAFFIRDIFDSKHPAPQCCHDTRHSPPRSVFFKNCREDCCSVRLLVLNSIFLFLNPTPAGFLEATGVVQLIPVDEVSPSITRHTTLSRDPGKCKDTTAIWYAKYIDEKMRDIYVHMQQGVGNERRVV